MIENARTKVFWAMVVLTVVFAVLTVVHSIWWLIGVVIAGALMLVGIWDLHADEAQPPAQLSDRRRMPASCSRMPAPSCTSTWWRTTPTVVRSIVTPVR